VIDTLLFAALVGFGGLLLVAGVSDRLIFRYKKTPGRGYAQIRNWRVPPWAADLHSTLELIGFVGFIATVAAMYFRLN
jgi:hypothetical protein